jgi:predicted DNA-binding transcriptional regulator AlpA
MQDDATRPTYLTPAQAGQVLGVSERALVEWRRTGRGPRYVRLGGPTGRVRYASDELDHYMSSRMFVSTSAESSARGDSGAA